MCVYKCCVNVFIYKKQEKTNKFTTIVFLFVKLWLSFSTSSN